jgi:hypothetical protein
MCKIYADNANQSHFMNTPLVKLPYFQGRKMQIMQAKYTKKHLVKCLNIS